MPDILKEKYKVQKFFLPSEVGAILRHASLVVSRSGINTVSELMALGCIALLIPLQVGKLKEQEDNAKFFKESGLGEYINQSDITPEALLHTIVFMIKNHGNYAKNREKASKYVTLNATENIVKVLNDIYERRDSSRSKKS